MDRSTEERSGERIRWKGQAFLAKMAAVREHTVSGFLVINATTTH